MATAGGERHPSVADLLAADPQHFRFFQAVRLLRLMHIQAYGNAGRGPDNALRFRTWLSLDSPASEIFDLTMPRDEDREGAGTMAVPEMIVTFMGLTGPLGALPRHYTEALIERRKLYNDDVAHDFFDLFSHRLIDLFARAWDKYRFFVFYERGVRDHVTRNLLDVVGMGAHALRNGLNRDGCGIEDETLAFYSGQLGQRPRSVSALVSVLSEYFGVEASVVQCRGQWLQVPVHACSRLGEVNHLLGESAMAGDRVWDMQRKCTIRMGPMSLHQFQRFLPDGEAYRALNRFLRWYLGLSIDFEIQLVLRRQEIPPAVLGGGFGARLGWSGWLKSRAFVSDADDAVFQYSDGVNA